MLRIIIMSIALIGCGTNTTKEVYKDLPDNPNAPPGGFNYASMELLIQEYCIGCHGNADFIRSEDALRDSAAFDKLFNEKMPPSGAKELPKTLREDALNFLG